MKHLDGDDRYMVLADDEADEKARDWILDRTWAFEFADEVLYRNKSHKKPPLTGKQKKAKNASKRSKKARKLNRSK